MSVFSTPAVASSFPAKGAYLYIERPVPADPRKIRAVVFHGEAVSNSARLALRHRDWLAVRSFRGWQSVSRPRCPEPERPRTDGVDVCLRPWPVQGTPALRSLPLCWTSGGRRSWPRGRSSDTAAVFSCPGGESYDPGASACRSSVTSAESYYALTQEAAAQILRSPFFSSLSRVDAGWCPANRPTRCSDALARVPVSEGANLDVIETKSRGEFLFRE